MSRLISIRHPDPGQDAKTAHLGFSPYSIFIDPQAVASCALPGCIAGLSDGYCCLLSMCVCGCTHMPFLLKQGKWLLGSLGFSFSGALRLDNPSMPSLFGHCQHPSYSAMQPSPEPRHASVPRCSGGSRWTVPSPSRDKRRIGKSSGVCLERMHF